MDSGLADAFDERLSSLESELFRLRSDLRAAREAAVPSQSPVPRSAVAPAASPPKAVPVPPPAAAPRPLPKVRTTGALETLIAGRGLQLAGLLLVLLGTAFFLELAFTRGWIGPPERILLGLIGGSVIIGLSARGLHGAWRYLAEGLIGLGGGILYLSIWASIAVFPELHVARGAAFAAMIAVTAVLAALAAVSRSERVAILGLIGGLLTPALLAGGPVNQAVLAAYLLILIAGMLALSTRCGFRVVDALVFLLALPYLSAFAPEEGWSDIDACVTASLFFLVFAVAFSLPRSDGPLAERGRAALLALDCVVYALVIEGVFATKQVVIGVALLVLAAVLLGAARIRAVPHVVQLTYAFSGLAALTLALPAILHETSLLDVFFVEAAVVYVLGTRAQNKLLAGVGVAIYLWTALALVLLSYIDPPGFGSGASLALSYVIAVGTLVAVRRQATPPSTTVDPIAWDGALVIALTLLALAGFTRLCLDLFGGAHWNIIVPSGAELALSALWTLVATVLLAAGMRFGSTVLRWEGLMLFGITIFKVFLVDLSSLQAEYRVGSFVGLGVVLVAVSTWYTRAALARKADA